MDVLKGENQRNLHSLVLDSAEVRSAIRSQIILTSSTKKFRKRLRESALPKDTMPVDADEYAGCLDWFTGAMGIHGVPHTSITMWKDLNNRSLDEFSQFGGIYMGGGITGRLNRILSQSVFPEIVKRALAGEIALYGGSAGAIVLGQTLRCVPEEIEDDYPVTQALGVIPKFSFRCHYKPHEDEVVSMIEGVVADGSQSVIAMPETSGLSFDGQVLTHEHSVYKRCTLMN